MGRLLERAVKNMKVETIASCLTNQALSLILMPTEQCNFRCTYCYEDFLIGRMSKEVIQGIKNLISIRVPEIKYLSIEWFGGEPLGAKDIIYEISDHILAGISNRNIHYVSGMTTNGFQLGTNTFKKLLAKGVTGYQISLDGPEEIHNKTRRRINGSGSFSKIWGNLLAMKKIDEDFKVMLRIHVTPENHHSLKELCHLIKKEFAHDQRFGVFFKAIENLGGENGGSFEILKGQTKKDILHELNDLVGSEKNFSPLDKAEPYICYAAKPNNIVIRADGTIAKCTVAFSDNRNNLGKITPDGKIKMNQEKLTLWTRGLKTLDESTLQCPANNLPKLNKNTFKNIEIVQKVG